MSRRGGAGREDGRFGASAWASARTVRRARDVMGEVKRDEGGAPCCANERGDGAILRRCYGGMTELVIEVELTLQRNGPTLRLCVFDLPKILF